MALKGEHQAMGKPYISILIDTYNHERFIEDAVNSVLTQDFPAAEREILVVDDGSTDQTPRILRKFEPEIRVLRKPNGGQASPLTMEFRSAREKSSPFLTATTGGRRRS